MLTFETAYAFLLVAHPIGDGLERGAKVCDFFVDAREGPRFVGPGAVVFDDRAQGVVRYRAGRLISARRATLVMVTGWPRASRSLQAASTALRVSLAAIRRRVRR